MIATIEAEVRCPQCGSDPNLEKLAAAMRAGQATFRCAKCGRVFTLQGAIGKLISITRG